MSGRHTLRVKCSGSKLSEAIPRAAVHAKLVQRIGTQASAESRSDSTHAHACGCTKSTSRQSATTHNCSQTAMLREYFWEVAETPNFRLPRAMSARARTHRGPRRHMPWHRISIVAVHFLEALSRHCAVVASAIDIASAGSRRALRHGRASPSKRRAPEHSCRGCAWRIPQPARMRALPQQIPVCTSAP